MGILERVAAARSETRYSADQYLSEYVMPFQYGGNTYGVPGANALVQTLAGNRATEIVRTLPGYAEALRQCPPAFSAQLVRAMVLSQARFAFRNRSTKKVFTNTRLGPLEKPWTGATTGELIARMEWHAGLAGNAFTARQAKRLRVLRPDWVAILYGSDQEPDDAAHALDGELLGYVYQNGGLWSDRGRPQVILPEDMAHWSPIPDPEAAGVGQSWITPAIRDMQKDRMAGEHTIRFFENGATPNLVVKGIPAATKEQFDLIVDMMESKHSGVANAYKSLYLTAGADASVVGANLADLDLKNVQGAAETRIASLSRVHPVILGIAEGLAGSSLNAGNFGMARRIWADTWIYPTLQDLAASLASIIDVPTDSELWFDTADIPLLREDGKDAADINATRASAIRQLTDAGFTAESSVDAVITGDFGRLKHSGLFSVQLQPPGAGQKDTTVDDVKAKVEALGGLFRAGFDAAESVKMLDLPPLKHTGLLPITLAKKEALPEQPTEKQPTPGGLRHMPGKHNQQNHSDGTGRIGGAVTKAAGKKIRGPRGYSMTVTSHPGRISVQIPRGEDEPLTVDVEVDAELIAEIDQLGETVRRYQARVREVIKRMDAAKPGSPDYLKAQDDFFALSGDGQRVAAGGREGDGGELYWDAIFEEEDQPTYRIAVRPDDADDDWDMDYAVDTPDGGVDLTAAGWRKFVAELGAA